MSKINDTYLETLEELFVDYDYKVSPRGMEIFEILNHSFMLDMDNPIISIPERKLNYNFMFGEAAWMLDGRNDVKTIEKYMKGITRFSDDGITFFGAYGPKIITQTSYIVNTLCNDQDSRQAVLSIWRENPKSSADIPCTLTMQFFLREGLLYCNTNMRSNDIWLGTPYDSFNFSAIAFYIACRLREKNIKCKLGRLSINAGSRHLYKSNYEAAYKLTEHENTYANVRFSFNDLIEKYSKEPSRFINNLYAAADLEGTELVPNGMLREKIDIFYG